MTKAGKRKIEASLQILAALGFPQAQQNERSALCLLALLDLRPRKLWPSAADPLMGITPIMDWARQHYGRDYAPNTRETIRRHSMHQFVQAGLAVRNPDNQERPVNSPNTVYQIAPLALDLLRAFDTPAWHDKLAVYMTKSEALATRYAKERARNRVPVQVAPGRRIKLSPGDHSELIQQVIDHFVPCHVPGSALAYVGDTEDKWAYFDKELLEKLGVTVDAHGKMPDVIFHHAAKNWLLLVEAVTSHGPVDSKRHTELAELFAGTTAGLVYVTAFPDMTIMSKYLSQIAWETEVWVAATPSHLIHFNGERFLGPHDTP